MGSKELDHDELISKFVNTTNCPIEVASDILIGADWDIEKALQFYFGDIIETQNNEHKEEIIPTSTELPFKESFLVTLSNSRFLEALTIAKEKGKLLCIYLSSESLKIPLLDSSIDHVFEKLEISLTEEDGKWVKNKYAVHRVPCILIIDPSSSDNPKKFSLNSPNEIPNILHPFINSCPNNININDIDIGQEFIVSSSHSECEMGESEDEQQKNSISLMIQTTNKKRFLLQISENANVSELYKKVSSLTGMSLNSFTLQMYPCCHLKDNDKILKELKCNGSIISIVPD